MVKTNDEKLIVDNLNYIGLDLKNIPDFLKNFKKVEFNPTKIYEQTECKVYRYIKLKDIQILLTPSNTESSLIEKYKYAKPLSEYLEDEIFFSKLLEKLNKQEIEKIEIEQNLANDKIPFKVEYQTNKSWQIFYSEDTGKYFMLISTQQLDYSALFFLLKKQIKLYDSKEEELIYVPITYLDYSETYLTATQMVDIEKYIWLFTKEWPKFYEVYTKDNELTLHLVGITGVYDKIKSCYKIELKSKHEANQFYTLIKSLFILKTELPHHYNFDTQINEKGELIFEFNNKLINYNNLSKFIKEEYKKKSQKLQEIFKEKENLEIRLDNLREEELEKNKEYLFRERQVSTYLLCRKSIFGKIKYFFNSKNGRFTKIKEKRSGINKTKEQNEIERSISNAIIEEKEIYNIEDLIKISLEVDRIELRIQNIQLDIGSIENKIKVIIEKINNATLFIDRIEEHRKSIFEFWRFSNKDVPISLNAGKEIQENNTQKNEEINHSESINIYLCSNDKLNLLETKKFYINPTDAINVVQDNKTSLYKIKVPINSKIECNQSVVELDMSEYKIDLKRQKIFRINYGANNFDFKERIICVYECEAIFKGDC